VATLWSGKAVRDTISNPGFSIPVILLYFTCDTIPNPVMIAYIIIRPQKKEGSIHISYVMAARHRKRAYR
jgi:hypothetical protein